MPDNGKVVVNLSTGLEDPERVTVAFLVGGIRRGQIRVPQPFGVPRA